jgi:heterotetrameric sarcosine oxidase gamma subunit
VSLDFLSAPVSQEDADAGAIARSPMEALERAAGARFEVRDGWNVALAYGDGDGEARRARQSVGWADVSHLGKLEVQCSMEDLPSIVRAGVGEEVRLKLGEATRAAGAWWCPLAPSRTLVIVDTANLAALRKRLSQAASEATGHASVVDVSTVFGALTLIGPQSREAFARFCALDLRDQITPVGALRPGSIARQPGVLVRENDERFLFLFGSAVGEYMWTVVEDAARHLGGAPIGLDALAAPAQPAGEEAQSRA